MKNILDEIILGNWGGIRLNANIDEDLKDVKWMIKYSDHGDEFLVVKTEDETYEYGWWLNRQWTPEYEDLIKSQEDYGFVRKPELFCAFDTNCELANEIYFYVKRNFYETGFFRSDFIQKEYSKSVAQHKFDNFIEYMKRVYEKRITYNKKDSMNDVVLYLKQNEILSQENVNKLDEVKWTSRTNGVDGYAGKKLYRGDRLNGDTVDFIYYKGEILNLNNVKIKHYYDRDGFDRFGLSLKQFQ